MRALHAALARALLVPASVGAASGHANLEETTSAANSVVLESPGTRRRRHVGG